MEHDEDVIFTAPVPPPLARGRKVLFVRHEVGDDESPAGREEGDIMLRRVPRETAQKFRAAAGGRALTHAQYLAGLVALHEAIRHRADAGNDELKQLLDELGLASVTV